MHNEQFDPFDTPYIETIDDYKRLYSDKCDEVLRLVFDIRQVEQERDQYKKMFDMQTKLVVDLEMRLLKMEEKLKNDT